MFVWAVYVKSNNIRYLGKGTGDLYIKGICGVIFTEIYVQDCIKYWDTLPNADTIVDYNLPSEFKIEFTIYSPNVAQNPSAAFLRFNSSNGVWVGKGSNYNGNIYFVGTTTVFSTINSNTEYNYVLTYENGVATLTDGTNTKSSTQTLTKLYTLVSWNYGKLLNVKVKPL